VRAVQTRRQFRVAGATEISFVTQHDGERNVSVASRAMVTHTTFAHWFSVVMGAMVHGSMFLSLSISA
jgi:hypothetical protein